MPDKISIGELLQGLRPVFNTIDFRVAAIKDGNKWVNGLSAIRVTRLPKTDVAEIHQSLRSKWGNVKFDGIRFDLTAFDFKECEQVFVGIRQGSVVLSGQSIDYPEPTDIAKLESGGYGLRPEAHWPFRIGLATRQPSIRWEDFDASLAQGSSPLTTLQALNTLLGLDGFSSNNSTQVLVGVPVYATVRNHSFSAGGLELDVEFDGNLTGISLTAFTSIGDGDSLRGLSTLELTSSDSTDIGDGLRRSKSIVQIEAREHDKLNLRLTHRPTGHEIESRRNDIRYYLEHQDKRYDPLATVFAAFCDYDLLEQYLTQPTSELAKGIKIAGGVQSLFEQSVAWLLALMGFRVVRLGGTVHEKFHGDPMMTTDVVGVLEERKIIVFCGCTLTDPPDSDFDKLIRCRDQVTGLIGGDGWISVLVVFTSVRVTAAKERGKRFGLTVMDADDFRSTMASLKQGDAARALEDCLDIWGPRAM